MNLPFHGALQGAVAAALLAATALAHAQQDPELARRLGADERGMRPYVLVVLKTGPSPVPAGKARDEMFAGHFANMARLASGNKLVMAGPLDGIDGWRGLFVFATGDLEEARRLVATDPVVASGEMTPELHRFYGSAGLMQLNDIHRRIAPEAPR